MIHYILYILVSLIICVLGWFVFKKLNWLDNPKKYGFDREAVPYSFGIVLYVVFLVGVIWFGLFTQLRIYLLGVSFLVLMSFLDDKFNLSPIFRFFWQIGCASIVVLGGGIGVKEFALPLNLGVVELGFLSSVVSIFWIVLVTNLMNFLDGVSGLSSGVSSNGFLFLMILAMVLGVSVQDQSLVFWVGGLMAWVAFIGLVLEFDSPKVLIGDSGTMWFGFSLAVLSMINGGKLATLGLVLIVPILDGVSIILLRLFNKRKPWEGDFNHLHHLLLRHGWSRRKIVLMYFLVSLFLGLLGILFWNSVMKFIILGLSIIGLMTVILWGHKRYGDWSRS